MTPENDNEKQAQLPENVGRALDEAIDEAAAQQEANEKALNGGDSPYPPPLVAGPQAHVNVWDKPAQRTTGYPGWITALSRARRR